VVFIASVTLKSTNLPITIVHNSQIKPKNTRIFHLTTDSRGFTQIRTNVSEVLNPCPLVTYSQLLKPSTLQPLYYPQIVRAKERQFLKQITGEPWIWSDKACNGRGDGDSFQGYI